MKPKKSKKCISICKHGRQCMHDACLGDHCTKHFIQIQNISKRQRKKEKKEQTWLEKWEKETSEKLNKGEDKEDVQPN